MDGTLEVFPRRAEDDDEWGSGEVEANLYPKPRRSWHVKGLPRLLIRFSRWERRDGARRRSSRSELRWYDPEVSKGKERGDQHGQVHADASNFAEATTKAEVYHQIVSASEALFEDQRNWVCNLANAASLLWHGLKSLPSPSRSINWAGFYVLDARNRGQLILGPFHGKVACQTITIGKGVCGTAAGSGETQLVRNVHDFPGHIACDSDTKSSVSRRHKSRRQQLTVYREIVVPIVLNSTIVGVIDLDCEERDGFDEQDQQFLEEFAGLLARSCDWDR